MAKPGRPAAWARAAATINPSGASWRVMPQSSRRSRTVLPVLLRPLIVAVPLGGLALLLLAPDTDFHWEHHPAHFWLVLSVSAVSVALGALTSEAATRRADARLFLVSLAFLASAGFLGLHALATPGVLLEGKNAGFTVATPVGLLLASVYAAWSAVDPLSPRVLAWRRWLRWSL